MAFDLEEHKKKFKSLGINKFLSEYHKIQGFSLRKLHKDDIDLIQAFFQRNADFFNIVNKDKKVDFDEAKQEWDFVHDGSVNEQKRWICLYDDQTLTMAALLEVVPYCPNPTDLFLALVIVDVEYRRHGLGKQLLQFVFDLAKKLKCTGYIKLLVEEWNNDSLSYWKKRGFTEYGTQQDLVFPDRDDILMKKPINSKDQQDDNKEINNVKK